MRFALLVGAALVAAGLVAEAASSHPASTRSRRARTVSISSAFSPVT